MKKNVLRIATCNFEADGKGVEALWMAMHDRLRALRLDLVLRQEIWLSGNRGGALHESAKEALGMNGWPSKGWSTAVYANPETFVALESWDRLTDTENVANRALRLRGAGPKSVPVVTASFHLSYHNTEERLHQAGELLYLADRKHQLTPDRSVQLPILALGGDSNSERMARPGEATRDLTKILDQAHLAHRTYLGPNGERLIDDRPDRVLRVVVEDVARHLAERPGSTGEILPTVYDSETQGPGTQIDRIYTSRVFLPALRSLEVVEMQGLTDHKVPVAEFDRDDVEEILSDYKPQPSDRITRSTSIAV